jgi:hypothetical protein
MAVILLTHRNNFVPILLSVLRGLTAKTGELLSYFRLALCDIDAFSSKTYFEKMLPRCRLFAMKYSHAAAHEHAIGISGPVKYRLKRIKVATRIVIHPPHLKRDKN